jgi:hypothetical protein|tara:strand:- start:10 stop:243 length:234 start_codon:yes stop_codon:yes gene_type:complete
MKQDNLELKIFAAALLLQELLDETVGETRFKHKMRHSINVMSKELDKVLTVEVANDVSILVNKVIQAIDDTIEKELQ